MKFAAVFCASAAALATHAAAAAPQAFPTFDEFVQQYDIALDGGDAEYAARRSIFDANVAKIAAHNADPTTAFTMGVNAFTHLTEKEFTESLVRGYNKHAARDAVMGGAAVEAPLHTHVPTSQLPRSLDWTAKSPAVVTPVKNQGGCGSCWAFSATESVESHLAIQFGKLFTLSPQQLVDCAPNPDECGGTGGCQGSTCPLAFNYTVTAGVLTEKQYPYKAETNKCDVAGLKPVAEVGGYVHLPTNNYTALMNAIQIEPVSISVAASAWGPYQGGIFDSSSCGTDINHAVQLVGYGVDKGVAYWKVRNSWGESWGEGGYIRIKRASNGRPQCAMDKTPQDGYACKGHDEPLQVCGLCGILSDSSYPTGGSINGIVVD